MANASPTLQGLIAPQSPRDRFATLLLQSGLDTSPVQHWSQGAARMAHALLGGLELKEQQEAPQRGIAEILRIYGGQNQPTQPTAAPRAPQAPPPGFAPTAPPFVPPTPRGFAPPAPPRPGSPNAVVSDAFSTLPSAPAADDPTMSVSPRQVAQANAPSPQVQAPARPPSSSLLPPSQTGPIPGAPLPGTGQQPQAPQSPSQQPRLSPQTIALLSSPDAVVRNLGVQMMTQELTQQKKYQVLGNSIYEIDERGQTIRRVAHEPQLTELERNAASENAARAQRGLPPLSVLEYQQQHEASQRQGQQQGEARANLDTTLASAQTALNTIEQLRSHPGRQWATGVAGVVPGIPGTAQRGFISLLDQAKGQTFLQAYNTLRGGGQITEVEGRKAEQAIARLDRAQRPEDFETALRDLESVIRDGMTRARLKAQGQVRAESGSVAGNDPLGIRR